MKNYKLSLIVLSLVCILIISSCSSSKVERVYHPDGRGITELDQLVVDSKNAFLSDCYELVAKRDIPSTECQVSFFELMDRRYGSQYNRIQVNRAADDYFFNTHIKVDLNRLIQTNPRVRRQVKKKFKSRDGLIGYYRKAYSFIGYKENGEY
jgi:hypothetical protein